MTAKEILKYAAKGITAEMQEIEKEIKQGYNYIKQIDDGEQVKIKLNKYEILDIIAEKEDQMKKLEKERFAIKWQIEVEMKDQN